MSSRRTIWMTCALCAAAVLLSACGSPDTEAGGGGSDPVVIDPVTPSPGLDEECGEFTPEGQDPDDPEGTVGYTPCPGDEPEMPQPGEGAERVVPQPGTENTQPRPFEMAKAGKGKKLKVFFWSGVEPCYVLDRVEVEETDSDVTVTLYEGSAPQDSDEPIACIELALYKVVHVTLERPLGDREVVDGAAAE